MDKKVLVTGGAGYVGSVLVRKLLDKGYKVRVIDNLLYGNEDSVKDLMGKEGFEFVLGSVCNKNDVMRALEGVDAVVHLAAIVGDPACALRPQMAVGVNRNASIELARMCREKGIARFIYASSCSVYGCNDNELREDSMLNPVSLYARTKIEAEKEIMALADDDFRPTVLRKATVYGPSYRMRFDLVVNVLTAKALKEKKIQIFGGKQWRPLIHVEDAADAYIKCLEAPLEEVGGHVFNVGSSSQNYQILDIGNIVRRKFPDVEVEVNEDDVDNRDYKVSFSKIEKLGFSMSKTVEDAVDDIKELMTSSCIDYCENKYSNYLSLR